MATCFLFVQQLDFDECLSVVLDSHGDVQEPLATRSLTELRSLQQHATKTIVVLPANVSSIHEVELPWLSERKAKAAIPYALEDHLAQQISRLHFCYDRHHYQNHKYLVVVTDQLLLAAYIDKLIASAIQFDVLTIDWFALQPNEALCYKNRLLVHEQQLQGALSAELVPLYLAAIPSHITIYSETDSINGTNSVIILAEPAELWLAQRLMFAKPMNLYQGDLVIKNSKRSIQSRYMVSGVFLVIWLLTIVLVNVINLYDLSLKHDALDKRIAVIYRQFFPGSKHIISPQFRINQFLKTKNKHNDERLWQLLETLAAALKGQQVRLQQLEFKNSILTISLCSQDFAALERFETKLHQLTVKITQKQASSNEQQVTAVLELTL
ncbi:MAG: type II secretion system protein GspL [Legionella sp.]